MRIERWPSIVALRLRTLLRRGEVERELDDEVRYHVERQTEQNAARGMSRVDARRAALVSFGGTERVKEETRDRIRSPMVAELVQDLRYAGRMAHRAPLLSVVAALTVGTATALCTSAFSAVNSLLLRALPYPDAGRLALVWATAPARGDQLEPVSFTNAADWRRDTKALSSLAMFSCTPRPIVAVGRGAPARTTRMEVSADFFGVLQARALIGRLFDAHDFEPGAPPTIVITHSLWRDRFRESPTVTASKVLVDGEPASVIGVLPPDFVALPTMLACHPEVYRPLASRYDDHQRSWTFLKAIGRLAPDASLRDAQTELTVEAARLASAYPDADRDHGARIVGLREYVTAPIRGGVLLVQAGAMLVLLIAWANIAGLLFTRAATRRRELAIRLAMGAGRARLVRQLATECAVLALSSGVVGVLLSFAASGVISRWSGDAFPDPRGVSLDWRALGVASALSLMATSVFALATIAAAVSDGRRPLVALRDGDRVATPSRSGFRRLVVVGQLAMATVVLVAAGLLARSYRRLLDVRPGFDPSGVVTARVTLPDALYPRGERQVRFFADVLDRVRRQPGVAAAGAVSILPESPNFDRTNAKVVGRTYALGEEPTPDVYRITPGYLDAMRIPVVAGRQFTSTDDDSHPLVAVVNETMARELFPRESAVGKRIWSGAGQAERTIVGVVGDAYQYGLDQSRTMQLYVPHADNSGGDLTLVVRSTENRPAVAAALRDAVHSIDPGVPVDEILSMDDVLSQSSSRRRLLAELSLAFAIGAVTLAAIGLYGVIAYGVSQRTREIGLRIALGATATEIARRIVADVVRMTAAGVVMGVLLAIWLVQLVSPLLFGVAARDPLTFTASCLLLLVVAVLAASVPVRRAAMVDPTVALRGD